MKKVLIIVFYWPPSGGSGVQRWLKFVKYLRAFQWEPIVFTPLNPATGETDLSLEKEIPENIQVIRHPIFDLNRYAKASSGNTPGKPGIKSRIFSYVRSNFLIPDPRILWKYPAVNFLSNWLKSHPVEAIVTSGPPQSMHLIGLDLHQKTGIPWLADFRDPWMQFLEFHGFSSDGFAVRQHRKLFHRVLQNANAITVAHPQMVNEFQQLTTSPVYAITNGFDPTDFPINPVPKSSETSQPVRLLFSGILYDKLHVAVFWETLSQLINQHHITPAHFEIHWVGKVHGETMHSLQQFELNPFCKFHGYVSHQEAIQQLCNADALLIFLPPNDHYSYLIPGKLFEYLGVGKPIWCVAPRNNDTSKIVVETHSGFVLDATDPDFKNSVAHALKLTLQRNPFQPADVTSYQRKNLTSKLADVLNQLSR